MTPMVRDESSETPISAQELKDDARVRQLKRAGLDIEHQRTVMHRDGTFEYDGRVFAVIDHGPSLGWEIWEPATGRRINDGFDSLSKIRDYVDEHRRNGWSLEVESYPRSSI